MKKRQSIDFLIFSSFLAGIGIIFLPSLFLFGASSNWGVFLWTISLGAVIIFFLIRKFSNELRRKMELLGTQVNRFAKGLPFERSILESPQELKTLSLEFGRLYASVIERQETMARQKHEVEAILQGMVEGVIVLDHHFIIRRINPAAQKLFPSNRDHQGLSLIDVCRNSALFTIARNLWEGTEGQINGEIILQDMTTTLSIQGAVLSGDDENRWGLVLVFRDITQIKRLEAMRKDFVANVSHELRTPLTSIRGYVETLSQGALEDPLNAKRFLGIIERQTDRMTQIIEDLLQLSRLENGQILEAAEECDLSLIINSVIQNSQTKIKKRELVLKINTTPMVVKCHKALIEQAVINLLDNGIKFSPVGKNIFLTLEKNESFALIKIQDQGPGILEKDRERIFERFFRTEKGRETEGTGLGLSIVKHIMAIHKGTVEYSPAPECGAIFQLALPLHG